MRQLLRIPIRAFSSTAVHVDKNLLSKLRKQTGVPFINCKKALSKFDNDFDQAKKWLLAEAQREGWTRATKLQARPMSQGLVALLADSRQATMIEVNCETDFVAKNEKFVAMVTKLVEECSRYFQGSSEAEISLAKSDLDQITSLDQGTLSDIVALNMGNLGENMALRRAVVLQAAGDNLLTSYVHPSGGSGPARLMLGKYGAVVELVSPPRSAPGSSVDELRPLGLELCQHIVGMNPRTVGEYTPTPPPSHAPNGYHSDVSSEDGEEFGGGRDDGKLLQQEFLLDPSVSVGEMLHKNGGASVARFFRFACGEELASENQ